MAEKKGRKWRASHMDALENGDLGTSKDVCTRTYVRGS
jgi:hypothetical protein